MPKRIQHTGLSMGRAIGGNAIEDERRLISGVRFDLSPVARTGGPGVWALVAAGVLARCPN